MREIKFRAWYQQKMYEWTNVNKSIISDMIERPKIFIGVQIMQFTGQKDKKGKEIYEGDIFGGEGLKPFVVQFIGLGYNFNRNTLKKWEIIGNKFENPELLVPKAETKSQEKSQ